MMDTSTAMVTTPAEPGSIDTTQPPYYYLATGPDARTIRELTLYVSWQLEAIYLVRVKGPSLRPPATFEIHRDQTTYSYHGELVRSIETKTVWMGTILIKPAGGGSTNIIIPDGTPLNTTDDRPAQPMVVTTSSKIKITKPPRFTGSKKSWEGFILAVDTYLMAYHEEFKNGEQKIWFVISYLGTEDGSQCVASDWIRNWKEENTYNHPLHADDFDKFLEDLRTAFEDPNLKVNAANELQQLWQGKDTLTEYFTKFELKAATARYRHLDNILIDLLKSQVWYEIRTELYRGGIQQITAKWNRDCETLKYRSRKKNWGKMLSTLEPRYHVDELHMLHHPNGTLTTLLLTQHPQQHKHTADKDSPWT